MITIDKSRFNAEQLAQYEALVAIGKADVDPEAAEKQMEEDKPPFPPKKKTEKAEVETMEKSASPELTAALEQLADLKKSIEMKEFTDIAKKYAVLGKNENDLAKTLYEMKKSNEANYDAFISVLDESLGIVEKSGIFTEIGKSGRGASAPSGAEEKAHAKAQELMKADPKMDYTTAIGKAWEDPAIMAEYDSKYFG